MSDEAVVPDERARREAADWFTLLNNRTVTTKALNEFRAWRKHPRNDAAYAEIDTVWRRANGLSYDIDILNAVNDAMIKKPRQMAFFFGPIGRSSSIALLAGLAALAVFAGYAMTQTGDRYATAVGEQRLIRLADGSRLRLDTGSEVRVRLGRSKRDVELTSGRAFFEVVPDPARPFVVAAGPMDVQAIGTRFEVRRGAQGALQVTLVEGSVRVALDKTERAWTLAPGQELVVAKRQAAPAVAKVDVASETSWTTGRLVFRGVPLGEAVAEVDRYDPKGVTLDAPELAATPVSGVFDSGDTTAFVAAVTDLYGLEADRQRDGTLVLRRPRS